MATKTPDTVDIISDLVDQLTPLFVIDSLDTNADGTYTLETLDTFWLRPEKVITIDSKDYRIVSFVINESITIKEIVTGAGIPTVSSFTIPKPNFYHGTPIMAAQEQGREKSAAGKTPFIWLYEVFNETVIDDRRSPYGRSSTPRLFFMDESKYADWTSEQHKTNAIEPIRQMSELLQDTIRGQRDMFDEVKERTEIARANWGQFVTDKGNARRFFNQDLSGIESTFDLVMTKKACDSRLGGITCTITVVVDTTNETSAGADDGTASATPSGGQGVLTYAWTGPNGYTSIDQNITGLEAGTYTVVVTDSITASCTATDNGEVEEGAVDLGNYLSFDQINDWVDLLSSVTLTGAFTFQVEFKIDSFAIWRPFVTDGNSYAFNFEDDSSFRFLSNNTPMIFDTPTMSTDTWYVAHLISDGVNSRCYLNNVESTTGALATGTFKMARIGALSSGSRPFGGGIDNIGVSTVAANSTQRANLLANPASFVTELGSAEVFYNMDQSGSDPDALDTSGNSNDGTLVNFSFTPSPWIAR